MTQEEITEEWGKCTARMEFYVKGVKEPYIVMVPPEGVEKVILRKRPEK